VLNDENHILGKAEKAEECAMIRAYFNCLTTGTNVPVVPGFVPVVLMFCPSCPDKNVAIQWQKCVGQMIQF